MWRDPRWWLAIVMYRLNACGALWQDHGRNRISPQMLKLVIGNKNYSSWSMRPWLALRANEIPFEEVFIPLYTDDKADKDRILSLSRAGKVPALVDGNVTVWDSLSIIEYLAEKFPQSRLWPEDRERRAHARSISAEMHFFFQAEDGIRDLTVTGVQTCALPI